MRGKGCPRLDTCDTGRITPAYAGKSRCENARLCGGQDHPRLCGEKITPDATLTSFTGSPPPMRGKVPAIQAGFGWLGITPAYAGKSRQHVRSRVPVQDHPRLCGEKEADVQFLSHSLGSPPPMRGKVARDATIFQCCRITPAYAGKRSAAYCFGVSVEDHPRLCGEKW